MNRAGANGEYRRQAAAQGWRFHGSGWWEDVEQNRDGSRRRVENWKLLSKRICRGRA